MISTRDLSLLPDIPRLKRLTQSLAMLDAILQPEWEMRYYSFDPQWKEGEQLASMRNGLGDGYFLLFTHAGAILKGFAHDSAMSPYQTAPARVWSGVLDEVPPIFSAFLSEPAFQMSDTTFCIWRTDADESWQHGPVNFPEDSDPDGSTDLLAMLDGQPKTYQLWAQELYERPLSLAPVTSIYAQYPLTAQVVLALNDDLSWVDAADEARRIGYPVR